MEASALTRVSGRGLLARRSPLLRFEADERLVDLIRAGHDGAFEALFNRYNSRLLGFCQSMLKSRQDAEDVLQEVFTNAHSAMLADERKINVRPWLYRIARNRCLNHLRKQVPEGQDSMDVLPHANGITTAEHVQNREDLRQLMADVETLPETQRTALLLREIDQLAYDEIAQAMQTTVPSVKSLLVRARIGLAESGQARLLTCEEVQVDPRRGRRGDRQGVRPGPQARPRLRGLQGVPRPAPLRPQGDGRALPDRPDRAVQARHRSPSSSAAAPRPGPQPVAQAPVPAPPGAVGGASAASGITGVGILGGAIGAKAVAGFATAAILTAGAVEVRNIGDGENNNPTPKAASVAAAVPSRPAQAHGQARRHDRARLRPSRPRVRPEAGSEPGRRPERRKPGHGRRPGERPTRRKRRSPGPRNRSRSIRGPTATSPSARRSMREPTGDGGQDTGSAPTDPTTPSIPTPTTPSVPPPTTPTDPPPDGTQTPPTTPPVDSTAPQAPPAG